MNPMHVCVCARACVRVCVCGCPVEGKLQLILGKPSLGLPNVALPQAQDFSCALLVMPCACADAGQLWA